MSGHPGDAEQTARRDLYGNRVGSPVVGSKARWFLTDGLPILLGVGGVVAAIFAAVFVVHAPQRVAHWWSCNSGATGMPAWSPDGRQIAFAAAGRCDAVIVAVNPDGTGRHVIVASFAQWPSWSARGRYLLVETHNGFATVGLRGGSARLVRRGSSDEGGELSPDGAQLAYTHGFLPSMGGDYQSTLYLVRRNGEGTPRALAGHSCDPGTPAWSPTGATIAVGCADGLYLLNPNTGARRRILKVPFGWEPPKPAWSPDGNRIAYVDSESGGLYVVSASGDGTARWLVSVNSHGWTDTAAWSPDGRWIAYSQSAGAASDGVYVVRANGHDSHRIAHL
jgi:Tol biopolymer transport system component